MGESKLQAEIKKKHPFELFEQEVSLNLMRTADALIGEFAQLYRKHNISHPQYNVLRILRGEGGDGLPCSEIADRMITRVPDITRLVDRLEQAGYVERHRTAQDRRVVLVRITKNGISLLSQLDQPVLELHREQLKHLTSAELMELNRLLVKVRTGPSIE